MTIIQADHEFKEGQRFFIVNLIRIYIEEEVFQYSVIVLMVVTDDGNYINFDKLKEIIDTQLDSSVAITGCTELSMKDAQYIHQFGEDSSFDEDMGINNNDEPEFDIEL